MLKYAVMFSSVTASHSCQLQQSLPEDKTRILSAVNEHIDHPFIQISVLNLDRHFPTCLAQTAYYFTLSTGSWKPQVDSVQWLCCKTVAMS